MKPIEIIASDLFDKVRSRFTNLQMGDEGGAVTVTPEDARFFDFDFVIEGNNLGRVSISINETGNLKIYYSQGITEASDSISQSMWYDFLREMRFFAKRRLLRFDTRDITKGNLDKTDFQYLAQNGNKDPNMNESAMYGSSKTSHRKLEDTDLIIRHSEAIDPTKPGARSRKIKNLFIQNSEGERFKFPFIYLPGARAMQRHIANGGVPHDDAGKHIIKTCEEIAKLGEFHKKVKYSTLNDNAHAIIERAIDKLKKLRHHCECMSKQGYYEQWKEAFHPDEDSITELDDATMESYRDTFTQEKFDEALQDMFPLIHRIMQEAGIVDLEDYVGEDVSGPADEEDDHDRGYNAFETFEGWADAIVENTLEPETVTQLSALMTQGLPEGGQGVDAYIQSLNAMGIDDDSLMDALEKINQMNPNADDQTIRSVIATWLEGEDPQAAQSILSQAQPQQQAQAEPAESFDIGMGQANMGEDADQYIACVVDFDRSGQPKVARTKPVSKERAEEIIAGAKTKNTFTNPPFMTIYPASEGKLDGETIMKKFPDMSKEDSAAMEETMKNKDVADKSYLKTAGKKQGVVGKTIDTMKQAGKWLAGKGGPGKEGPTYEGYYLGPEDLPDWTKDAVHRVAAGKVKDWTELYAELISDLGIEGDKAERIARRIYGHDSLAKYKVKAQGDMEKDIPSDSDSSDDDAEFLSKMRSQARSGSIKSNDFGAEKDEDSIDPDTSDDEKLIEPEGPKQASKEDIAKAVIGFFDKEHGTWTKGRPGIVASVTREFGEEAGELAKHLIIALSKKYPMRDEPETDEPEVESQMESIRKLAGLPALTEAEKKKWVKDAVKGVKKGALSKQEGKKKGEKFSKSELKGLKKSGTPLEKKRANFALNIQKKK